MIRNITAGHCKQRNLHASTEGLIETSGVIFCDLPEFLVTSHVPFYPLSTLVTYSVQLLSIAN